MKVYDYALSITSQFYFCGIPFRLDSTPKCDLNCVYCFAMARGGRSTSASLAVDEPRISRKLRRVLGANASELDVHGELLKSKVPVHFGGISDPFSNENSSQLSINLLKSLSEYDYPTVLSTKNTGVLTKDETMRVLKEMKHVVVQVSLTTLDRESANLIEPNVPSPEERIKSLRLLSDEGIHTVARLQPLLFPWIDVTVDELIPALGESGCKHVIVEFLKLPVEKKISALGSMFEALGWDGQQFYDRAGALLVGREWVLPSRLKWESLQPIVDAIHQQGMTYGAGDYGLNHMGDTDCCCGLDGLEGFSNWFRGNLANVIRHSCSGCIGPKELMKYWFPTRSIKRYVNSNCRLRRGNAVLDYLMHKWNRPGTANAPDTFLDISWTGDYDQNGNCIYFKEKVL